MVKLGPDGARLWERNVAGSSPRALGVALDVNGFPVTCGATQSSGLIVAYTSTGTELWRSLQAVDMYVRIVADGLGGLFAVGTHFNQQTNADFVAKVASRPVAWPARGVASQEP